MRKSLHDYLKNKMDLVAPNLCALIGEIIGARLISHAGSLTNLAKYPASTVQILGAEKALFRALKTRGNTPKYGLIFHSSFIGRAGAKNKGRISRFLANKCSIASRIDAFSETPNTIFGEKLKEQVEERLKMFEDGDVPRKNVDVMKDALAAVKASQGESEEVPTGTKRKLEEPAVEGSEEPVKKKKKKKKKTAEAEEPSEEAETKTEESAEPETESPKKKKKKKKKKSKTEEAETVSTEAAEEVATEEASTEGGEKKKKKKKKKKAAESEE